MYDWTSQKSQQEPELLGYSSAPPPPYRPERRRRKRTLIPILLGMTLAVVVTVVALLGGGYWWLHRTVNQNIQQADTYTDEELAVTDKNDIVDDIIGNLPHLTPGEVDAVVEGVRNIALFGVDQEDGSVGRSDAMIILSIDGNNQKIKLTTLSRDSLVPIEGHGEEKLTHAWAYGQTRLALKTINQAFGMNITDYVYVNFEEFIEVINYIGGVELDVNEVELKAINYTSDKNKKLPGTGVHRLTGEQALIYARCRADNDTNRNARQREVLIAMYEQVRSQPINKLPETLRMVLQLCHTTLSSDDIMNIARWAILKSPEIETLHLPNKVLKPWNGIIDNARGWVRVYDLDAAKKVLYNFIYEVDAEITGVTKYDPASKTR